MLIYLLLFACFTSTCLGGCSYDMMFPSSYALKDPVTRYESTPFGIYDLYDTDDGNVTSCEEFCKVAHWCYAVADTEIATCQFHTDLSALGLNSQVFNDTILNVDGRVFGIVDLDNTFGGHVGEQMLPSRLIEFDTGGDLFCSILKTNLEVASVQTDVTSVYSDFYGQKPVSYDVWTKDVPSSYFQLATNVAVSGFPIIGMFKLEPDPLQDDSEYLHWEQYRYLRHKYTQQKECSVSTEDSDFIDLQALQSFDTYFFIKQIYNDTEYKYFNCNLEEDDDTNACFWEDEPQVMWGVGDFNLDSTFEYYNKTLIAYDLNTAEEIGWLRRSKCGEDSPDTAEDPGSPLSLLEGGKKSGEPDVHCGVYSWSFARHPEEEGFFVTGSSLCHKDYRNSDGSVALLCLSGHDNNITGTYADLCSVNYHSEYNETYSACSVGNDNVRAGAIVTEHVDYSHDGQLFSIHTDNSKTLSLHCNRFTEECTWIDNSTQVFKFNSNGVHPSVDNPQTNFTNAVQGITVYETDGRSPFYNPVGFVYTNGTTLKLTTKFNHSHTGFIRDGDSVLQKTTGLYLKVGSTDNEDAVFDSSADVLYFENATSLTTSHDDFKWFQDTEQCPEGYYLHQIRCKSDQNCREIDIGCVKENPRCLLDRNTESQTMNISLGFFTDCPEGFVVTGVEPGLTMNCSKVIIDHHYPNDHEFPQGPSLGVVSNKNILFNRNPASQRSDWAGPVPIQQLSTELNKISGWGYETDFCTKNSSLSVASRSNRIPTRRINTVRNATKCPLDNQFVSFIRCLDTDCGKGIEFYCDTVDNCGHSGNTTVVIDETCPYGTAITSIGCVSSDEERPCSVLEYGCTELTLSLGATAPPQPEVPAKQSHSNTSAIVLLGIGIPVIIVIVILVCCFIPDNERNAKSKYHAKQEYVKPAALVETSTGLRRRHVTKTYVF